MTKAGRPRLSDRKRKNQMIGVRVTVGESKRFKACAKRDKISISAWGRKAMLFAAKNGIPKESEAGE